MLVILIKMSEDDGHPYKRQVPGLAGLHRAVTDRHYYLLPVRVFIKRRPTSALVRNRHGDTGRASRSPPAVSTVFGKSPAERTLQKMAQLPNEAEAVQEGPTSRGALTYR